jgi:hypothetical protein
MPSAEVRQLLVDGEIAVGKIVDPQVAQGTDAQAVLPAVRKGGRNFPLEKSAIGGGLGDNGKLLAALEKQDGQVAVHADGAPEDPHFAAAFQDFAAVGKFDADFPLTRLEQRGQQQPPRQQSSKNHRI